MVRLEGVLVEQDGEVRVASVRNELVGDVRNVITGFLQNDCVESSARGCNDLCGIPVRWSWIPLQNGEAILMMHEVTFRIVNVTKFQQVWLVQNRSQARTEAVALAKDHFPHVDLCQWHGGFPPRRYLHSFCT